jgi:hypothetical protein
LDAFVGNLGSDEVWLNDGNGIFTHSGQTLGNSRTRFLYLADLDDDGNLDGFVGGDKTSRIWLNDGFGNFEVTDQKFDHSWGHAVALGDVDGNGTVDVVIGKLLIIEKCMSHLFIQFSREPSKQACKRF